jgi:hypothetical protein
VFDDSRLPRSPACRPAMLEVVVYSGEKASTSFKNFGGVGRYLLRGARGRVVLDVPWFGRPPYRVVNSTPRSRIRRTGFATGWSASRSRAAGWR